MRVVVTGSAGQLGSELVTLLAENGDDVLGVDLPAIDITDPESVAAVLDAFEPDVVINCAAWTAVDAAEEQEDAALRVNGEGPRVLAEACRERGAWLVQVSTDYVFDGRATSPYAEDARPDPQGAYGRTKLAGELAVQSVLPNAHYLVRTAWLYGVSGGNFVRTMLRLEGERDTVSVVTDQVGQPTYARDLARQVIALLEARPPAGTFHGTNSGEVSWFDFTREIFRLAGADPARVLPTTSAEFVRPAPRPAYSVLGHERWADAGLAPMRPWQEALADAFADGISAG
jgi:dTDP-4-dehydrorhamnose reductase